MSQKAQLGAIAMAEKYLDHDQIEIAKAFLITALPNPDACRKLGVLEFLNGNLSDAQRCLESSYQIGDMKSLPWLAEIEKIDGLAKKPVKYQDALNLAHFKDIGDALYGTFQVQGINGQYEDQIDTLTRLIAIDYPDAYAQLCMALSYPKLFDSYRDSLVNYGLIPSSSVRNNSELTEIGAQHFKRAMELQSKLIKGHAVTVFFANGLLKEGLSLLTEQARVSPEMLVDYLLFKHFIMKDLSDTEWIRFELNEYGILEYFEVFLQEPNLGGRDLDEPFESNEWNYFPVMGISANSNDFLNLMLDEGFLPVSIKGRVYLAKPTQSFDLRNLWSHLIIK